MPKFHRSGLILSGYKKLSWEIPGEYDYGFKPVFLVEKNKKTTSYAGG
ncbi:hypothetical protein [Streptococcus pseudopneumoniae]|nr:hypothetical protein [Streptococcus pseudopneumoniae]ETE05495.1 hypothetical protein U751_06785 [Streptococcus pseudopneumoniae 22725]MBF9679462.1 hypothetical protein [Streptococcus pseudopneumoniae]